MRKMLPLRLPFTVFVTVLLSLANLLSCNTDPEDLYDPTPVVVELPQFVYTYLGAMPNSPDNPLTEEGIALGKKLFYEKKLSDNATISCASCHKQENAFSDPQPFSEGTNGALGKRNAMSIANLAWGNTLFWDGRRNTLEGQAHDPVTNPIEMRNTWAEVERRLQNDSEYPSLFFKAFGTRQIDSNLVVKAIAQFERTLVSFASRFDQYYFEGQTNVLNTDELAGAELFFGKAHCNDCHSDVLLTDNFLRNNGLDQTFLDKGYGKVTGNSMDDGKFKVPTLRNIALTSPYMHDSRFTTLEQVVEHYSSGVMPSSPNIDEHISPFGTGFNLTSEEKDKLVAFLRTMSDSLFITNPKYAE